MPVLGLANDFLNNTHTHTQLVCLHFPPICGSKHNVYKREFMINYPYLTLPRYLLPHIQAYQKISIS